MIATSELSSGGGDGMAEFMICLFIFCLLLAGVVFCIRGLCILSDRIREMQCNMVELAENQDFWTKEICESLDNQKCCCGGDKDATL